MLFNSLAYLLFLPAVTASYFLLRGRARRILLLAASCAFYMAYVPAYILVLLALVAIDYSAALLIARAEGAARKALLGASLLATGLVLYAFKYHDFVAGQMALLLGSAGWAARPAFLELALPVGLSFHTFQSVGYVIDVYRGDQEAERDPLDYALFVLFFPQLLAGPIEKARAMLPQFKAELRFDAARASEGLRWIAWGLALKVLVADRIAPVVDAAYADPAGMTGPVAAFATVLFAFQLYGDFAGYSFMALGSALVLGFRLTRNFEAPFFSRNLSEFWRRWHVSLNAWFREYLYRPLLGPRASPLRAYAAILAVFLASGLWHGANWTYVVWGALNGFYLAFGRLTAPARAALARSFGLAEAPRLHAALQVFATFALFCSTLLFFRAESIADAALILGNAEEGWGSILAPGGLDVALKDLAVPKGELLLACLAPLLVSAEGLGRRFDLRSSLLARPAWFRYAAYSLCGWILLLYGSFAGRDFIYYAF